MSWVRLDDGIFRSRKILDLSPNAKLLFVAGLCHCSEQLTDGFISTGAAKGTAGLLGVPWTAHKALVNAGLWHKRADGFDVHDYLDYQPSAEAEVLKRTHEAERKKRWREANTRRQTTSSPASVPPNVPPGQTLSVHPSVTAEKTGEPDSQALRLSSAFDLSLGRDTKSDESQEIYLKPKARPLMARWLAVCDPNPNVQRRLAAEGPRWLNHLVNHVDPQLIDEAIGTCAAQSATPPRTMEYLVVTVRGMARQHDPTVTIPDPPTTPETTT
jgi:hypothetical protein